RSVIEKNYSNFFGVQEVDPDSKICAITGIESSLCVKLDKDSDGDAIWVLPSVKEQVELGKRLRAKENFKTLEEYADGTYLGILRMDVDGLGKVFIEGFPSMAAYEEFSNRLDIFFQVKLKEIQRRKEYADYLNIVYAGGDDIFAVGRWDRLIDFANEVRQRFAEHVNRKGISISGGIAIVDDKFPIAKAAELAGEAESAAKSFNNGAKNAFNMFGATVSWQDEFGFVESYKDKLVELCENAKMPRSIMHRLMVFADMKQRGDLSYVWNTTYFLARFRHEHEKNELVVDFCKRLESDLFKDRSRMDRNYELIALAARWAELILRKNDIENQ
ncbi:MAG: hypothetical protein HUJ90_05680, partial [Bacteroidales bacterium]|nr:hypothetical protein [Bacteroidales bacterium]